MAQLPATTLTATGATGSLFMSRGLVEISGTFVGTVNIQIDVLGDGTWANAVDTAGTAAALTAPGVLKINNGVGCNTRVNCSAYTSGSIVVGLKGF